MTPHWARALEEAAAQLLTAFALATAVVCLLAALVLLSERLTRRNPPAGAYVGRRSAAGLEVYFVAHTHIARLVDPRTGQLASPAWGAGADTEPLAAALLGHYTGRSRPAERHVSALGMWLEIQPRDGFLLESAELPQIVGAPLAGRRRWQPAGPRPRRPVRAP